MQQNKTIFHVSLITLAATLLFIPFLGGIHLFDWDEINFAESAREMIVTGDYMTVQINYQAFWEKPPFFIWLQALSMNIFGINEFAARLPNALCGIFTLVILYIIGKKHYNSKFSLLWILAYAGSFLPHFYFRSGIIDPWFNLFIFLGIYFLIRFTAPNTQSGYKKIILSAFFIGMGILTKGPVALLIFLLCTGVYWIIKRFKIPLTFGHIATYALVLILVGGFWFIIQILSGNFQVVLDFIHYQIRLLQTQDAGHGGFLFYHPVILFFGVFPASLFALPAFRKNYADNPEQKHMKIWMLILFWVVVILFSVVKTKIVHYSSLAYFPLTFLAAYVIYNMINHNIKYPGWLNLLLIFVAVIYALAVSGLYAVANYKDLFIEKAWVSKDVAQSLEHNAHWQGFEFLIGAVLLAGIIFSILFFTKEKVFFRATGIFITSLVFTVLSIYFVVPRVEKYSQNVMIDFCKKHREHYCETLGFKSYAHLFYAKRKPPPENIDKYSDRWFLNGDINKPVYFICPSSKAEKIHKKHPQLKFLYQKGRFSFFVRKE